VARPLPMPKYKSLTPIPIQVTRKLPSGFGTGSFVVTLLPPGNYAIVVNKPGFAEAKSAAVEVRRYGNHTRVTIPLKPGAVTENSRDQRLSHHSVEVGNATTGQIDYGQHGGVPCPGFAELSAAADFYSAGAQSSALNHSTQLGRGGDVRINVNGPAQRTTTTI